jgi:hypothetical protein
MVGSDPVKKAIRMVHRRLEVISKPLLEPIFGHFVKKFLAKRSVNILTG